MTMSQFAQRLTKLLEEREMSRADLARGTNIPYHRLNPWFIRPAAKPSAPDLLAVADHLGVSEDYLLGSSTSPDGDHALSQAEEEIRTLVSRLSDPLRRQLLGYAQGLVDAQENDTQSTREESE